MRSADQAGVDAETVEGESGVGHGAACCENRRSDVDELARDEEFAETGRALLERGDDVQADVPGHDTWWSRECRLATSISAPRSSAWRIRSRYCFIG